MEVTGIRLQLPALQLKPLAPEHFVQRRRSDNPISPHQQSLRVGCSDSLESRISQGTKATFQYP